MCIGGFLYGRLCCEKPQRGTVNVPLVGVKTTARIVSYTAEVTLRQRFENVENDPIEAIYNFPLLENAAVCSFEAFIDGRKIEGIIKGKEKARETYDEAISASYSVFLLEEVTEKKNVFEASIGNLPPKQEAIIIIKYVVELNVASDNSINFSLITSQGHPSSKKFEKFHVPQYPPKETENFGIGYGLNVEIFLDMPFPIKTVHSETHEILIEIGIYQAKIMLINTPELPLSKDFMLSIVLEDEVEVYRNLSSFLQTTQYTIAPSLSTCVRDFVNTDSLFDSKMDLLFCGEAPEEEKGFDDSLDHVLAQINKFVPETFRERVKDCIHSIFRIECDGYIGTAFHYGGGWVLTNAHVLPITHIDTSKLTRWVKSNSSTETIDLKDCKAYSFVPPENFQSETPDLILFFVPSLIHTGFSSLPSFSMSLNIEMGVSFEGLGSQLDIGFLFSLHFGDPTESKRYPMQFSQGQITKTTLQGPVPIIVHTAESYRGSSGAPILCIYNNPSYNRHLIGITCAGRVGIPNYIHAIPNYLHFFGKPRTLDKAGIGGILGRFVSHIKEANQDLSYVAKTLNVSILLYDPAAINSKVVLFPSPNLNVFHESIDQVLKSILGEIEYSVLMKGKAKRASISKVYFPGASFPQPRNHSIDQVYLGVWWIGDNCLYNKVEGRDIYRKAILRDALKITNAETFGNKMFKVKSDYRDEVKGTSNIKNPLPENWIHFGYCLAEFTDTSKPHNPPLYSFCVAANWNSTKAGLHPENWIAKKFPKDSDGEHTEVFCFNRLFEWLSSYHHFNKPELDEEKSNVSFKFKLQIRFATEKPVCQNCAARETQFKKWLQANDCGFQMQS